MMEKHDMQLRFVHAYSDYIREVYKDEPKGAERLLRILRVYGQHLVRRSAPFQLRPEELQPLKSCIRQAEILINDITANEPEMMAGWYMGSSSANSAQHLANLLWEIVMALTIEIDQNESLYPELKTYFDVERQHYRKMLAEAESEGTNIDELCQ